MPFGTGKRHNLRVQATYSTTEATFLSRWKRHLFYGWSDIFYDWSDLRLTCAPITRKFWILLSLIILYIHLYYILYIIIYILYYNWSGEGLLHKNVPKTRRSQSSMEDLGIGTRGRWIVYRGWEAKRGEQARYNLLPQRTSLYTTHFGISLTLPSLIILYIHNI